MIARGFTIMELLVVITILVVLGGLILSTTGYVQKKGARSRAETEVAAIAAACESYRADNGTYPQDPVTDGLDPAIPVNFARYSIAGNILYKELSGDMDGAPGTPGDDKKNYIGALLRSSSLATPPGGNLYFKDPWGNAYGYSTSKSSGGPGYNPTFDLWSTGGTTAGTDQAQWIKNW